jgi:death on curing protein
MNRPVTYLTAAQVLFIHDRLIAETGSSPGIRDLALLAAAVARPQATVSGKELYPDLVTKAAALLEALVRNQPFVQSNERVGITAAALFLERNGHRLTATRAALEHFTLAVAHGAGSLAQMTTWFEQESKSHNG